MTVRVCAVLAMLLIPSAAEAQEPARPRGHSPINRVNLPPGWDWPPTPAMLATGKRCLAELDRLGVRYRLPTKPRRRIGRIATPIVVHDMVFGALRLRPVHRIYRRKGFVMDCHLALALATHGNALLRADIPEIRFASIYTFRRARLAGRQRSMLSRHALGLAIDVRAVVTSDGRVHTVRRSYRAPDGVLLRAEKALVDNGGFRAVVTPGNDRAHVDHFHLSAKMDILGSPPERYVQPHELLASERKYRRRRMRRRVESRPMR